MGYPNVSSLAVCVRASPASRNEELSDARQSNLSDPQAGKISPRTRRRRRLAPGARRNWIKGQRGQADFSACFSSRSMMTTLEQIMRKLLTYATAAGCLVAFVSVAQARSAYDGSWDLVFVTQRGACDPTYNFTVNVSDGVVTHPNLVRFRGHVAKSGSVHASVTVQDKFASGTGRLFGTSGRGSWSGYAGSGRCSGYWTAQRN